MVRLQLYICTCITLCKTSMYFKFGEVSVSHFDFQNHFIQNRLFFRSWFLSWLSSFGKKNCERELSWTPSQEISCIYLSLFIILMCIFLEGNENQGSKIPDAAALYCAHEIIIDWMCGWVESFCSISLILHSKWQMDSYRYKPV